jgi:hypothetical protein
MDPFLGGEDKLSETEKVASLHHSVALIYFEHVEKQIALATTKAGLLITTIALLLNGYIGLIKDFHFFQEPSCTLNHFRGCLIYVSYVSMFFAGLCLVTALLYALWGTLPKVIPDGYIPIEENNSTENSAPWPAFLIWLVDRFNDFLKRIDVKHPSFEKPDSTENKETEEKSSGILFYGKVAGICNSSFPNRFKNELKSDESVTNELLAQTWGKSRWLVQMYGRIRRAMTLTMITITLVSVAIATHWVSV